jgi:hypothetical protein
LLIETQKPISSALQSAINNHQSAIALTVCLPALPGETDFTIEAFLHLR